jgi:hypothetical protein
MKFKYPSGTLLKNIQPLSIVNVDDSDTDVDNGELFLVFDVDYTDQECTLLCQKDGMYSKWEFDDMYRGYFRRIV